MSGFGGNDIFVFNSALGNGNVNRVTDFNPSQNKIHLDDAILAQVFGNRPRQCSRSES